MAASRTEYVAQWRRRAAARIAKNPNDPAHGTPNGYTNYQCHCLRCKRAHAKDHQRYRAQRRAK